MKGPDDRLGRRLVLWPDRASGTLGLQRLDDAVAADARGMLAAGRTGLLHVGHDGERRGDDLTLFVNSFAPPARMVVFGAIDFAAAVARVGAFLGYRVTVCDARPVFATPKRFPDAHEVIVEWPHRYLQAEVDAGRIDERTVLCVLTHDPKFDVPLLEVALRIPVAYVGAMGSRRTHEERRGAAARGGADGGGDRAGSPRRSGWTWAPGRRRRPRCRSPRRSSPGAGAARGSGWPGSTGPIHRTADARPPPGPAASLRGVGGAGSSYSGTGIPFPVCRPPRRSSFPGLQDLAGRRRELIDELVRARQESELSQTEIAARMGTSQSAVARLESGDAGRPAVDAGALRGRAGPHRGLAGPTVRGVAMSTDRYVRSTWPPLPPTPPDPPLPPAHARGCPTRGRRRPGRSSASACVVVGGPDWLAQRLLDQRRGRRSPASWTTTTVNRAVAALGLLDASGDDAGPPAAVRRERRPRTRR